MRSEKEINHFLDVIDKKLEYNGGLNKVDRVGREKHLSLEETQILQTAVIKLTLEWVLGKNSKQMRWEVENR